MKKTKAQQIVPHKFEPKLAVNNTMRVFIQPQVMRDMQTIISLTDEEIAFMGLVRNHDDRAYEIYELLLPKQDIASHTCELSPEGMGELAEKLIAERPEEYNNLRAWFHSHHTMGVDSSSQDDNQWKELAANCEDYFIRGICNKKGDLKLDINLISIGYNVTDIPWVVIQAGEDKKEFWQKEFDEKVSHLAHTQIGFDSDDWQHGNYWKGGHRQNYNNLIGYAENLFNEGWRCDPQAAITKTSLKLRADNGVTTYRQCSKFTYEDIEKMTLEAKTEIETDADILQEAILYNEQGWTTVVGGTIGIKREDPKTKMYEHDTVSHAVFVEMQNLEFDMEA